MTPQDVLARLRARRVEVLVEGQRLRLRAPVGAITEELLRTVALHKVSLLRLLTNGMPGARGERIVHMLALLQAHCTHRSWLVAVIRGGVVGERLVQRADLAWDDVAREARRFVVDGETTDARLRAALARHEALTLVEARERKRSPCEGAS